MSKTYHHGDKAKKRRFGKNWLWLKERPSWWIKMFSTKPKRREIKMWETSVVKENTAELDSLNKPDVSNKPQKYYW